MEIKVFDTGAEAARFVADEIVGLNQRLKGKMNLGVATGRTMDAVYHNLVKRSLELGLDYSNTKTFALDEYVGLEPGSMNSYRKYLDHHLHSQLNFSKENTYLPEVLDDDVDSSSLHYEALIKNSGGIDLQLLGIGLNGHIALNEPGSSADSRTRVVALTESTKSSNKVLFKNERIPLTALTMGIGTILEAKKCVLLATGETKSQIIKDIIEGEISSHVPGSFLRENKNTLFVLDRFSAKLL